MSLDLFSHVMGWDMLCYMYMYPYLFYYLLRVVSSVCCRVSLSHLGGVCDHVEDFRFLGEPQGLTGSVLSTGFVLYFTPLTVGLLVLPLAVGYNHSLVLCTLRNRICSWTRGGPSLLPNDVLVIRFVLNSYALCLFNSIHSYLTF